MHREPKPVGEVGDASGVDGTAGVHLPTRAAQGREVVAGKRQTAPDAGAQHLRGDHRENPVGGADERHSDRSTLGLVPVEPRLRSAPRQYVEEGESKVVGILEAGVAGCRPAGESRTRYRRPRRSDRASMLAAPYGPLTLASTLSALPVSRESSECPQSTSPPSHVRWA